MDLIGGLRRTLGEGLRRGWRATGAELPGGDLVAARGVSMDGWFWHITDPASGRVVLGGSASGVFDDGSTRWEFDGAQVYAEKNWGRGGFPVLGGGARRRASPIRRPASPSAVARSTWDARGATRGCRRR